MFYLESLLAINSLAALRMRISILIFFLDRRTREWNEIEPINICVVDLICVFNVFNAKKLTEKRLEITGKNTVISPDFLVWKFCGKTQFLHSFGRIARNYAETVPFCKICTPANQVKLRYFSQWMASEGKLNLNKYIHFFITPMEGTWKHERLIF